MKKDQAITFEQFERAAEKVRQELAEKPMRMDLDPLKMLMQALRDEQRRIPVFATEPSPNPHIRDTYRVTYYGKVVAHTIDKAWADQIADAMNRALP